jgi:hypothetical protein
MAKKTKQKEADEHKLELIRRAPVHAVCSCGGWRYKADLEFESVIEAVQHVDKWHRSHRRIEARKAA